MRYADPINVIVIGSGNNSVSEKSIWSFVLISNGTLLPVLAAQPKSIHHHQCS